MTECYNGEPWISWEVLGLEVKVGLQHHHIHYPPPHYHHHQLLVLRSRSVHDDNSTFTYHHQYQCQDPYRSTNKYLKFKYDQDHRCIDCCHHYYHWPGQHVLLSSFPPLPSLSSSRTTSTIHIPTDKYRCHHSLHPGQQVPLPSLSSFRTTSTS